MANGNFLSSHKVMELGFNLFIYIRDGKSSVVEARAVRENSIMPPKNTLCKSCAMAMVRVLFSNKRYLGYSGVAIESNLQKYY
jgi:hypothetical protein